MLVQHWQTENRSHCVQSDGMRLFIIFLCFFSRGIPNYDFKIGKITFIRNSRPLVKKVEEVNKVGSFSVCAELERWNYCPSCGPSVRARSVTVRCCHKGAVAKTRCELGGSGLWCPCLPVDKDWLSAGSGSQRVLAWEVTKMVVFYFQEESGYVVGEGCEMLTVSCCSEGTFFPAIAGLSSRTSLCSAKR